MFYRYDTARRRAYFGYRGKQSFTDAPSRTDGFKLVHLNGKKDLIGKTVRAEITRSSTVALFGKVME